MKILFAAGFLVSFNKKGLQEIRNSKRGVTLFLR